MLASVAGAGDGAVAAGEALTCDLFREALETLDPEAVLLLDNSAADVMRETYADMLVAIDDFDTAMLKPGWSPMCRGVACWRSTVLRRRSLTKPPSSACGPTLSS